MQTMHLPGNEGGDMNDQQKNFRKKSGVGLQTAALTRPRHGTHVLNPLPVIWLLAPDDKKY